MFTDNGLSTVKSLTEAIRFAYSIRRKNKDKDIPWTGLEKWPYRPPHIGGCNPGPREMLTADGLCYAEERDRDALTEIVRLAVQLGIQEGCDMMAEKIKDRDEIIAYLRESLDYRLNRK